MEITQITKQKRGSRYNIFADGRFVTGISELALAQRGWAAGDRLTTADLEGLADEDGYAKVLSKAYEYLARRGHSVTELRQKLVRKEYPTPVIEQVLGDLLERGYLNDTQFAKDWVHSRNVSRGPALLRQELRRKGIPNDVIASALDGSSENELESASVIARKKLRTMRGQPWEVIYRRLTGYLNRRGFSYDTTRTVTETIKAELA